MKVAQTYLLEQTWSIPQPLSTRSFRVLLTATESNNRPGLSPDNKLRGCSLKC